MKKTAIILFAAAFMFITACARTEDTNKVTIVMPDGAPSLIFAQMMKEDKTLNGYNMDYQIVAGVQGIQAKINEFDIAVIPLNLGANLYNKGEDIRLVSVNVHGVLYIVGKEGGIETLEDLNTLKGKTVYNIGKGGTPDITFKYILDRAEIPYEETDGESIPGVVALKYVTDGSLILAGLKSGTIDYAILGEPAVTNAVTITDAVIAGDIQQLWKEATGQDDEYSYPQAGIFVKSSFVENNKELLKTIISKVENATEWLKENKDDAITAMKEHNGTLSIINLESINRSNIYTVYANEAKQTVDNYLTILHGINPILIGGSVPALSSNFYYNII